MDKKQQQAELEKHIKEFLKKGGEIQQIKPGVCTEDANKMLRPMREDYHKNNE